ncbi:MAG TPA: histidine kinase, partial [Chitinophagaceae bacterium]|nr:histidine kinase [Chitinophagaceae bacterium]
TTTAENLLLSFENCLVLLLPKLLFTYFILNFTLNKILGDGFKKKEALYSVFALLATLLVYRGLAVFFIDPIIYGWDSSTSSFFYPLAFPVALMDIGFVSGAAIALKQIRQQLRRAKVEQLLIREKLETELKYLRNQTNPHFLFNTLNNIYALARKKSDDTADAVMKLSKLLRFMLYDTAKPLITIGDEVRMLEDYIDLEKIRYNGKLTLSFVKDISDEKVTISPLLLLPFVENAFKHGVSESRFASTIDIETKVQDGILKFSVKNTKENNNLECTGATIGLNNVKRQLELLYKEYDLQVLSETSVFIVLLTINLNSYANNTLSNS